MKLRKHRKYTQQFYPRKDSKLDFKPFKYKKDLMNFLTSNLDEAVGGTVRYHEKNAHSSGDIRMWYIWYNQYKYLNKGAKFKIELRNQAFRGRRFIFKRDRIPKAEKIYKAFSDKVIRAMCNFDYSKKSAERLVELFYKRGFKDFEPSKEEWEYINGHIEEDISFFYWSDRCYTLRVKTVIEYLKRLNLI